MSFDRERGRHEAWEELISASVTGDLTEQEHRRLEAHLATCEICQATFEAFDDSRRVVAGLRHYAPPRDLGARVRAGIESGAFSGTPWWRRPPAIFAGLAGSLAVVAGALLALVVINDGRPDPNVGRTSPTPTASVAPASVSQLPEPSLEPIPSQTADAPSLAPAVTPGPSTAPDPDATPTPIVTPPALAASPEPDLYVALTGPADSQAMTLREGGSGDTVGEVATDETGTPGVPIAAAMSADGRWLATITRVAGSGTQQVNVTRLADPADAPAPGAPEPPSTPIEVGTTLLLGEGREGSPFLEHLSWSRDGRFVAFTLADLEADGTDAFVFDVTDGATTRLTDDGAGYAGSFVTADDGSAALWISTAGDEPISRLVRIPDDGPQPIDVDAVDEADVARNVFQPLVSSNDAFAIFWRGRMALVEGEWVFEIGGAPYLAEHQRDDSGAITFPQDRLLFLDVIIDRDAFTSAAVTWGPEGYTYAVWEAAWTGIPQSPEGRYPDIKQVYFGTIADGGITRGGALAAELPADTSVVDVKIAPTGRHLLVTIQYALGGDLDVPTADLLLIERHFDGEADDVRRLNSRTNGWFGPAAFSERWSNTDEAP